MAYVSEVNDPQLVVRDDFSKTVETRHQPGVREVVPAADGEGSLPCLLLENGQYLAHVPKAFRCGIRKATTARGQLQSIAPSREQGEATLPLEIRDMPADRRCGDAQFTSGKHQVPMGELAGNRATVD